LEGDIPLPLEDVVIDAVAIKEKKGAKVFAFALPKELFKEHLNLFPEGFKPKIVIPDFVSLSFLKLSEQKEEAGILEVGDEKLTLIATSSGKLHAARSIASKNKNGIANGDVKEIASTLTDWKANGIDIKKVFICGDHAGDVKKDDLSTQINADIIDIAPSSNSDSHISLKKGDSTRIKDPSRFASLIGTGYINLDVNLLRSEEEEKKAEYFRKRIIQSGIALAILLILGLIDLFISYSFLQNQYSDAKQEVRRTFQEILPQVNNIVDEKSQLKTAIKEEKDNLQLIRGETLADYDIFPVLDSFINETLVGNVVITELKIEEDISFQGEAKDQASIDAYIESLRKASHIGEVIIKRIEHIIDSFRFQGTATVARENS
jgi:hypothetical protein